MSKGLVKEKGLEEIGLTHDQQAWIAQAVHAYYTDRIHKVLNQVGTQSSAQVLELWNEVLDDMYGDDEVTKKERSGLMIETALHHESVSEDAKNWLRGLSQS